MNEVVKHRIEQIKQGEVPDGYKRTKVGIVPEEWENSLFSNLFVPYNERTQDLKKYPLYSLTIEDGITAKTERYERSHLVKKEDSYKVVRPNDFAYNPMNLRFGAVSRHKGNNHVCVSGYYDIFTTQHKSDLLFMDSYLVSNKMITYYNKVATGSLVEKQRVHFSQFLEFNLPLPDLKEREKIAEILATQDKVIALKEKLLEEKKKQKKYLMQQLLTGKKRLPGFTDRYFAQKMKTIIRETSFRSNDGINRNVMSVSNVKGFVSQTEQFDKIVASNDTSNYKIVKYGTLAYNPSRINVGSLALYKGNQEIIVSPMYSTFIALGNLNMDYLLYWFKSFGFTSQLKKYLSGSVRNSLSISDLLLFDIRLPYIEEQNAIVEVLSNADKEISIIQKSIDQEKQKKKALMQLLLTGIVRV